MEGVFVRKKYGFWLTVVLVYVAVFTTRYLIPCLSEPEFTGKPTGFILLGILLGIVLTFGVRFNRGAYIHIGEDRVQAKYHWFGKLDCAMDEVAFVLPQINTLTILLKNGKRHMIIGLENSWELSAALRSRCFEPETQSPQSLRQELARLQAVGKKEMFWVVGGCIFVFVPIFAAVLLTDGRELHEFGCTDWIVLAAMGVISLLTFIGVFCIADRRGKRNLPMEQLKYRLRIGVILSQPLPSGVIRSVYTDVECTMRLVIYGFPNDEGSYYCVQRFNGGTSLETVHTSEIGDTAIVLEDEGFSQLVEITTWVAPGQSCSK